nr:MAG TPA: hypothetical protein [Caudoviricetes sp.]
MLKTLIKILKKQRHMHDWELIRYSPVNLYRCSKCGRYKI